jgi:hypothetical protein
MAAPKLVKPRPTARGWAGTQRHAPLCRKKRWFWRVAGGIALIEWIQPLVRAQPGAHFAGEIIDGQDFLRSGARDVGDRHG